jgi:hypothetical protein
LIGGRHLLLFIFPAILGFPHVAAKVVDSIALFLSFNEKDMGEPID